MTLVAKIKVRNNYIRSYDSKFNEFKITTDIVYFLNNFDRRYINHVFKNFIIEVKYKDNINFNLYIFNIDCIINNETKIYEDLNEVKLNKSILKNNKSSFNDLTIQQDNNNLDDKSVGKETVFNILSKFVGF